MAWFWTGCWAGAEAGLRTEPSWASQINGLQRGERKPGLRAKIPGRQLLFLFFSSNLFSKLFKTVLNSLNFRQKHIAQA